MLINHFPVFGSGVALQVEVFKIDEATGALTRTCTAAAPCAADVAVV